MLDNTINFHETPFRDPEARRKASLLSDEERMEMVNRLLVPYVTFEESVSFIRKRHRPNPRGGYSKGKVYGLLGESRTGKSYACMYYARSLRVEDPGDDGFVCPVVYVPVPGKPTVEAVTNRLLRGTRMQSISYTNAEDAKETCVKRLLRARSELVIFDDSQFMFFARSPGLVDDFFDLVKRIVDTRRMNVLLCGEEKVYDYVRSNDHLFKRGSFPHLVVKALVEVKPNKPKFKALLESIDDRLPFLRSSNFGAQHVVDDFHRISGGMIGLVMNIIIDAAEMAIADGSDCIELRHLQEQADDRFQDDTYKYFRSTVWGAA